MSTIGVLIARVEARIALASGLDVQIVDEPRMLEMLRSTYNKLFDQSWWPNYMELHTFTLSGVNGLITEDVTGIINRFEDIHSIFYDDQPDPIGIIKFNYNPRQTRRPGYAPYTSDPTKMFKVYPLDSTSELNVWLRTRLTDEQWEEDNDETEVNFDDECLILGTVYEYLSDDGSNADATEKYKNDFEQRVRQITKLQFNAPIPKSSDSSNWPTSWSDNG